jgi:hypothetical protein
MACDKVKAWLSQAGVDFIAHNVETDIAAYDALSRSACAACRSP